MLDARVPEEQESTRGRGDSSCYYGARGDEHKALTFAAGRNFPRRLPYRLFVAVGVVGPRVA